MQFTIKIKSKVGNLVLDANSLGYFNPVSLCIVTQHQPLYINSKNSNH